MAKTRTRRRSQRVERGSIRGTMLAAGTVGALVIGTGLWLDKPDTPLARDHYASQEDCQADWGKDAASCAAGDASQLLSDSSTTATSNSTSSSFHSTGSSGLRPIWYGPSYPQHDREGAMRQAWSGQAPASGFAPGNRSIGRSTVSRGGFGSSSHSSSSGHSSSSS